MTLTSLVIPIQTGLPPPPALSTSISSTSTSTNNRGMVYSSASSTTSNGWVYTVKTGTPRPDGGISSDANKMKLLELGWIGLLSLLVV